MNEITEEDDPEFYKTCLKAHGYKFEESEDGKSESDEELRSMKPPPIPYNKFKNRIIQIGSNSRIIAKKKGNNKKKKNKTSKKKSVEQSKTPTQILSVSTVSQTYSSFAEGTHISNLDQNNPLSNGNTADDNKLISSSVGGVHADSLTQLLSVSPKRPLYNPFAEVARMSSLDRRDALRNGNNVDGNKLMSPKKGGVPIDISTQFLAVTSQRPTDNPFTGVTHTSTLDRHNEVPNGNQIQDNKSISSRVGAVHTSIEYLPVSSPRLTCNRDDNKLVSRTASGAHATTPTQIPSVSSSRQNYNSLAKMTRTSNRYQSLRNGHGAASNESVSSRVNEEQTTTSPGYCRIEEERNNENRNQEFPTTKAKILRVLCCNII